jgi:hypothetical protein
MPSTRDLTAFPAPDRLRGLCQSLAMLDAILCPEWEYRYHSFDSQWDTDTALATMRDGSGDHVLLLFGPSGTLVKGFGHEAPMSPYRSVTPRIWPGVLDTLPPVFAAWRTEAALAWDETTFCLWRISDDEQWACGAIDFPLEADPDGSQALLAMYAGAH